MSMINVPISTSKFLELGNFLKEVGSDRDPVGAIEDAIDYWIDNARWKTSDLLPETIKHLPKADYIWAAKDKRSKEPLKPVVLPHGTILRFTAKNGTDQALVDDGKINFNGATLRSPNEFVQMAAGHPRDAWEYVWVRRPSDKHFMRADDLREINRKEKGA